MKPAPGPAHRSRALPDDPIGQRATGERARWAVSPWCHRLQVALTLGLVLSGAAWADDAEKAKTIVANTCAACHGMDGNSTMPNFPKLAGRHPEYLVRELKEFISGKRKSAIMAPIAAALDPDDLKALGAYFGAQKPTSGQVLDPQAAANGEKGEGQAEKFYPLVAGQHFKYLLREARFIRDGKRGNANPDMARVIKSYTDDDIEAVSDYMSGLAAP